MAFVRKTESKSAPAPVPEFEDLSTPETLIAMAKELGLDTAPLNVTGLAKHLGISVRYVPMEGDDSGNLKLDKKTGVWIMQVNSLHHPHRQRFTIAHEIAHRIRHASNSDVFNDKTFFRNGDSNWMEAEANKFAAELLMPAVEFSDFISSVSSRVEDIAMHFQVSSTAVRIRAKDLGYDGHNL